MDKVGEQLPSIGTALAGLILVFLGVVFTAWESYEPTARSAVRARYRLRAWIAFSGFVLSMASALCGLIGIGINHVPICADYLGVIFLVLAGIATGAVALLVLLDI